MMTFREKLKMFHLIKVPSHRLIIIILIMIILVRILLQFAKKVINPPTTITKRVTTTEVLELINVPR